MPNPKQSTDLKPITEWVVALQQNNQSAATSLWESFRDRIELVAKRELAKLPPAAAFDEEDVALSAFYTFCHQIEGGTFSIPTNRDELWWLLIVITKRKAGERVKHEGAQKRNSKGNSKALSDSELQQVATHDADPQELFQMRENCNHLLESLEDDELRIIAIWKLEGYTNSEIANRLMRTRQTIQRKLNLIRSIWAQELMEES